MIDDYLVDLASCVAEVLREPGGRPSDELRHARVTMRWRRVRRLQSHRPFSLRALVIPSAVRAARGHDPARRDDRARTAIDDAIVVVEEGEIELVGRHGGTLHVGRGGVLWLSGVALRALRNPGDVSAVSRRCDGYHQRRVHELPEHGRGGDHPDDVPRLRRQGPGAPGAGQGGPRRRPDPAARDARTVAFLTSLDLDPVAILGRRAGRRCRASVALSRPDPLAVALRLASSARPIGSHSLLTAQ